MAPQPLCSQDMVRFYPLGPNEDEETGGYQPPEVMFDDVLLAKLRVQKVSAMVQGSSSAVATRVFGKGFSAKTRAGHLVVVPPFSQAT